jgi:uncharacterized repeat protein (TIGR03803 family)
MCGSRINHAAKLRVCCEAAEDEVALHSFGGSDGAYPISNLVIDGNGNLYGTASAGGAYGYGVVWELTP